MPIKYLMQRYTSNDEGHIAIITSILALPLLLGVSVAVDHYRVGLERTKLEAALDGAALAAISNQTITQSERSEYAKARFWSNVSAEENVKFSVESSTDTRIDLQAEMEVNTLFASIIGRDTVTFEADSAAAITKGSTVCMLALDPYSHRAFEVTTGATLQANCTVQVNSLSKVASVVDGGGTATAQGFCVGGRASGEHKPFVNTECATLNDPYANLEIPDTSLPCENFTELAALLSDWRSTRDAVDNHNRSQDESKANAEKLGYDFERYDVERNHLKPGNYCRGIYFSANELILDPGEYHITGGDLLLYNGTKLTGKGVTFILHGDAKLVVGNGSILDIAGPTEGPLDGLVFAQNLKDKSIYNPNYPNVTSTITSGSVFDVLGTIYLPSHEIRFEHGISGTTHAPATSFIAHQISLSEGADVTVSVDHEGAGISPIKPRSDEGVRLVK